MTLPVDAPYCCPVQSLVGRGKMSLCPERMTEWRTERCACVLPQVRPGQFMWAMLTRWYLTGSGAAIKEGDLCSDSRIRIESGLSGSGKRSSSVRCAGWD